LIAFLLNTKLKIIGVVTITQGTLDCSLAHPREVLRPAILANASSLILAHNHPSGDLTPSREDWQVYRQIREAGKTVGIECIDSIIVNDEGESFSMSECGA
jgi:DNA repair protein RadC